MSDERRRDGSQRPSRPARDVGRLGGIEWVERTNGALTTGERFRLALPILRGLAQASAGRLALLTGRRGQVAIEVPSPPDSAMTREARHAAADQSAPLLGHAYRTWAFGAALAALDDSAGLDHGLDHELFYVASLLHDVGLVEAVTGEDFTLRSAAAAGPIVTTHRDAETGDLVRDAISAHATPGASIAVDGPEAFYVQAGATCDLGGLRLHHLPDAFVDQVLGDHPRTGLTADITERVAAEAAAVPSGRFALLRWTGLNLAIRLGPLPDD